MARTWLVCPVIRCDKQIDQKALEVHLKLSHGLNPEQITEKAVDGRTKTEVMSMGKAQKAAAKELGIRCFNAMTKEELAEAIELAQVIVRDGSTPGVQARLEAIQAAARERTKARFAAIKAKKEQQSAT